MPLISVVIPTYKRPDLLRRAVDSVLAQTFTDFELLISDDEDPPGPAWSYLQQLAASHPNIRVLRNPPPHGQAPNMNNLLRAARGEWIKPLHDDDRLRPRCLELFAAAVSDQPSVVIASCDLIRYFNGRQVGSDQPPPPSEPLRLLVPQRYTHLGMYLQDSVGGGLPTQVMVRRSAVEKGCYWEVPPGIKTTVDSVWSLSLCRFGDSLILRLPLAEWHQGDHESVTSQAQFRDLDAELLCLRRLQLPHIPPELHPPSLPAIEGMLRLIRAAQRASQKQFLAALRLAVGVWRPQSWKLFLEWAARRSGKSHVTRIPHQPLPDTPLLPLLTPVR